MSKQEEYYKRLLEVHGDTYTFDKNTIEEHRKKVTYYCKKHGQKFAKLSHLLDGQGCDECAREKLNEKNRKDTTYFIKKGKEVYGDLHDYSISEYKGALKKVDVICKKHGLFHAIPSNYYRGMSGCKGCTSEKIRKSKLKPRQYYIDKLHKVHGNKYDFSESNIVDTRGEITYICKIHGEKKAKLNNLLNGMGCSSCRDEKASKNNTIPPEIYFERLNEIYKGEYIFNIDTIGKSDEKIEYQCKKHGTKKGVLSDILKGRICKECFHERHPGVYNETLVERNKKEYLKVKANLYLLKIYNEETKFLKIGISKNIPRRINKVKNESNMNVELIDFIEGNLYYIFKREQYLLNKYKKYKYRNNNTFKGHTECLRYEILDDILKKLKVLKKDKKLRIKVK